jgi:hypothetical protein
MAVLRRLQKTNKQPEKASAASASLQMRAKPSIPFLKSTASTATQMRI